MVPGGRLPSTMNTTDRFVRFAGEARAKAVAELRSLARTMGVQFKILPLRHSKAKAAPNLSRLRLNLAMTSPSAISTSRPLQPRRARASDAKFGLGNSMPCLFLVENGSKTGVSALAAQGFAQVEHVPSATSDYSISNGHRLSSRARKGTRGRGADWHRAARPKVS